LLTGKELRRIRLQLGLTQEGMAKMVGVADGTVISRYERGSRKVSPMLAIIARHLAAGCRLVRRRA
jgi:transcriptional regulator with XRE-family HTH domain